jgi:hypothetical protein
VTIRVTIANPLATCPMCSRTFPVEGRGVYCGPTCRQRAHRLRHRQVDTATLTVLTEHLRREQRLITQTVYDCSSCQERSLGERRCSSCNLWCRNRGVGGECTDCGQIVTISELLGIDLLGGHAVA